MTKARARRITPLFATFVLSGSLAALLILSGCTPAQINTAMQTPTGALFCAIQLNGGGAMVVTLLDAQASAAAPAAAPIAIIATGLGKTIVDGDCAAAAASMGGVGAAAVSPPVNPDAVPKVAVVVAKAS